jgi:hypothetical protein
MKKIYKLPHSLLPNPPHPSLHTAPEELSLIDEAMNSFSEKTSGCIKWVPRAEEDEDYVAIRE